MRLSLPSILLGALAFAAVWFTFPHSGAVEYSGFAVGLVKLALGLGAYMVVDNIAFRQVDTIKEITEKGNVPYAIVHLGFAIVIAAAIVNV